MQKEFEFWVDGKRFWLEEWKGESRWGTERIDRMGYSRTLHGDPFPTDAEAQQDAIRYAMGHAEAARRIAGVR